MPGARLVVFTIEQVRYGLPLETVDRIVRVVQITPLPRAPEIVLGVINVQGRVIAVMNMRRRLGLREREVSLSDQLILARTRERVVALLVDDVTGVLEYAEDAAMPAKAIVHGTRHVAGVVSLSDGLVLIHDLAGFLSLEEEKALDEALSGG